MLPIIGGGLRSRLFDPSEVTGTGKRVCHENRFVKTPMRDPERARLFLDMALRLRRDPGLNWRWRYGCRAHTQENETHETGISNSLPVSR
jgi:hypothetical protein